MIFDGELALTLIKRPPLDAVKSNRYGFLNPSNAISLFKKDSSCLDSATQRIPTESEIKVFRSFNLFRMEFWGYRFLKLYRPFIEEPSLLLETGKTFLCHTQSR